MPEITIKDVISFSSEDSSKTVNNIINGKGSWLCSAADKTGILKAELQLEKTTSINYIDIGNANSSLVSIDVGRSIWPTSQSFVPLLSTVALMTPQDIRSSSNSSTVRMFKQSDLEQEAYAQKWDRIRITCSQPFKKGVQFGLSFIKFYTTQNKTFNTAKTTTESGVELKYTKSNLVANMNLPSAAKTSLSPSVNSIEQQRMGKQKNITSTISSPCLSNYSRAAKLIMSTKAVPNNEDTKAKQKDLELKALNFIISLQLDFSQLLSLKVKDVREQFEATEKRCLNASEKSIFKEIALDYATKKLETFQQNQQLTDKSESSLPSSMHNIDNENNINKNSNNNKLKNFCSEAALSTSAIKSPHTFSLKYKSFTFRKSPSRTTKAQSNSSINKLVDLGEENGRHDDITLLTSESVRSSTTAIVASNSTRTAESERSHSPVATLKAKSKSHSPDRLALTPPSAKRGRRAGPDPSDFSNIGVWLTPPNTKKKSKQEDNYELPSSESFLNLNRSIIPVSKRTNDVLDEENALDERHDTPELTQCPICMKMFYSHQIESHASQCEVYQLDSNSSDQNTEDTVECPVCSLLFPHSLVETHAASCAEKNFA